MGRPGEYARPRIADSGRKRAVGACCDTRQGERQTVPARVLRSNSGRTKAVCAQRIGRQARRMRRRRIAWPPDEQNVLGEARVNVCFRVPLHA